MRRVLMLVAAAAIPASGAFLTLSGGQAWAKGGPNGKVTCTTISGTATSEITISGCTDTGSADTGASSEPFAATALENGGTITWISGDTSTFGKPTLTSTSAKHCPVAGSTADKLVGAVTGGTAGLKTGAYKGAVCIAPTTEAITALKPLKA
jgi:hypothetical protein